MIPEQYQNLEIIQRLSGDHSGSELRDMLDELQTGRNQAKAKLDAGVSPAEYDQLQGAILAFDSASEVLPKLWQAVRAA